MSILEVDRHGCVDPGISRPPCAGIPCWFPSCTQTMRPGRSSRLRSSPQSAISGAFVSTATPSKVSESCLSAQTISGWLLSRWPLTNSMVPRRGCAFSSIRHRDKPHRPWGIPRKHAPARHRKRGRHCRNGRGSGSCRAQTSLRGNLGWPRFATGSGMGFRRVFRDVSAMVTQTSRSPIP